MKDALTDRGIAKLVAPTKGRVEVLDRKMPGLAIRVAPSGKKTWTVVWHRGRQTRRYASHAGFFSSPRGLLLDQPQYSSRFDPSAEQDDP